MIFIRKNVNRYVALQLCMALLLFLTGCGRETSSDGTKSKNIEELNNDITAEESNQISMTEYKYTFKSHVISDEYRHIYGEEVEKEFFDLCNTVLAVGKSFSCESKERFYKLLSISSSCFPLAGELINNEKTYVENGICYLAYCYTESEAKEIIVAFQEKVHEFIQKTIPYDVPDYIKAMELYTALAKKDHYDYSISLDDVLTLKTYRVIMNDVGICQEIAREYIYYLLQVGINAIPCTALNRDQSEAHEWALISLDGKYYHVDPTFAINYSDSLYFFGLDDKQREYYGDFPIERFNYADTEVTERNQYKAEDRRFEKFWLAKDYEIDYAGRKIIITDKNSDEKIEYGFDD